MRVVHEDPKLGISKVVWRFTEEPDTFKMPEEPVLTETPVFEVPTPEIPSEVPEPIPETDPVIPVADTPVPSGHLADLRQQIQFLQQVVESQNQQLKTKDELIRNFQVLLKTEQEQVMKLETHAVKTTAETPASMTQTGWFQRLKNNVMKQYR